MSDSRRATPSGDPMLTGLLYHIWPGILPLPTASVTTLAEYNKKFTPVTQGSPQRKLWQNRPKYVASFLETMFGEDCSKLRKTNSAYSWMPEA